VWKKHACSFTAIAAASAMMTIGPDYQVELNSSNTKSKLCSCWGCKRFQVTQGAAFSCRLKPPSALKWMSGQR
jgi:hypothetical protein